MPLSLDYQCFIVHDKWIPSGNVMFERWVICALLLCLQFLCTLSCFFGWKVEGERHTGVYRPKPPLPNLPPSFHFRRYPCFSRRPNSAARLPFNIALVFVLKTNPHPPTHSFSTAIIPSSLSLQAFPPPPQIQLGSITSNHIHLQNLYSTLVTHFGD